MILAAGLGVRLRPLTHELPKAAVPVALRPVSAYAMDAAATAGATRIVVNVYHLANELIQALKPYLLADVETRILREPSLLGTGGALLHAAPLLVDGAAAEEPIVVINGDTIANVDLLNAVRAHEQSGAIATLVLRTAEPGVAGPIGMDAHGRVCQLFGNPVSENAQRYAFTGVHVFSARALKDMPNEGCVIRTTYRHWIDQGEHVHGWVDDSPWYEVGTLDQYLETNLAFASGTISWPGFHADASGNLIAMHASVHRDCIHHSVIGDYAKVAPGVQLHRVVVWDHATVIESLTNAIVTPTQIIRLDQLV